MSNGLKTVQPEGYGPTVDPADAHSSSFALGDAVVAAVLRKLEDSPRRAESADSAWEIPEELLRLAERLARVRLRLGQLARLVDVDETTAEWDQMLEGKIPFSVAFVLHGGLDGLAGHLEDVETFLRKTAFIPTKGHPRTIPEIQAELRLLAPEVVSVRLEVQVLWQELGRSRGESSALRELARSFASGYTAGLWSKADSLKEAEANLLEDSCATDEGLAREFHERRENVRGRHLAGVVEGTAS